MVTSGQYARLSPSRLLKAQPFCRRCLEIDLGLDRSHVYIFWSAEYRSGLEAGSAEASWVSFPLGRPDESQATQVMLPGEYPGLPLRRLPSPVWKARMTQKMLPDLVELPPKGVRHFSGFIYMPAVVPGQRAELPVTFSMMVKYRMRSHVQPVLTLFSGGQLIGYQMAGRTRHFSLHPRLARDEAGNLHLVWVDRSASCSRCKHSKLPSLLPSSTTMISYERPRASNVAVSCS